MRAPRAIVTRVKYRLNISDHLELTVTANLHVDARRRQAILKHVSTCRDADLVVQQADLNDSQSVATLTP
jgi:hypothetical protein